METLNYKVLESTGYNGYILKDAPVKVMQFGEGNFLRAFVDYFFDIANEKAGYNGKVKLVQPIANFPQMADWINEQEGLYTLYLRGSEKGQKVDAKRVISCVHDCVCPYSEGKWDEVLALARSEDLEIVVSNTTEAGIAYTQGDSQFDQVPPNSFPAKLTRVLYERYTAFKGAADKGLVILSCELIDNNGKELQKCCNNYAKDWNLDAAFIDWMNNANTFCSTLVDRIVPGRIRDPKEMAALEEANGYTDKALDVGEVFGVWVIEGRLHEQDAARGSHPHPASGQEGPRGVRFCCAGPLQQPVHQPRADEHFPELHLQVEGPQHAFLPGLYRGAEEAAQVPDHVSGCLHRFLLQRHSGAHC